MEDWDLLCASHCCCALVTLRYYRMSPSRLTVCPKELGLEARSV